MLGSKTHLKSRFCAILKKIKGAWCKDLRFEIDWPVDDEDEHEGDGEPHLEDHGEDRPGICHHGKVEEQALVRAR